MRTHHKRWLWLTCGRCCITLRPIGRHSKNYYPYEMHHANYKSDRLWWNVLPVSKGFHTGIMHGALSGGLSAGEQRRKTGHYPNLPQTLLHWWGRVILLVLLTWQLKMHLLAVILATLIAYQLFA
ncbi:hypothetical protein H6F86_02025 [Phormidium sp. FACHB-592]|uniref:Uncharacterized protein n=1 Tax=Stenomitos frigidus AS-A4 TaxID=2933935 RepID=A0ABV0KK51_9CYAN|nr:hypothetical protein [Phormidium sp. FACHB-592]MBD2072684.1 hypothetical protein [Phormidium sp. FACHB-592]